MKSLNHTFRTRWSEALGVWIAVSEITKTKGKRCASSCIRALRIDKVHSVVDSGDLGVRLKPFLFALACCFAFNAQANPIGGAVVNGQASFNTSGNTLTVTNTPGTIINWQGFSINAGEVTRFAQQSAASTVLNRVVTNNPSVILGTLSSNGQVYLVNANGIMFGAGSTVDVAGLVATTLNLSDADFLSGKHNYTAVAGAGNVSNAGNISAQQNGFIYLIAPNVENTGIITAPNGEILLVAGAEVQLVNGLDPNLRVSITAPAGNATNLGQLIAESGSLGLFGTMVKNSGAVSADSATMQGGKIVFKASQRSEISGIVSANGTTGGTIEVLGNQAGVMDGAVVTANGAQGGGTVLVGGDYQGKNPGVQNAQVTYVAPTSSIQADATDNGNGGKVIVWANDTTRSYGNISARGGANGGNGGFVETSGHNYLDFQGVVNTGASQGLAGTLLLDPADITIDNSANTWNGTVIGGVFSGGISPSYITWSTLNAQTGNVQINTTGSVGTGIVNINASGSITGPTTLTVLANSDINIATNVAVSSTGDINLIAGWNNSGMAVTPGTGTITLNPGSSISTTGNIWLNAGNSVVEAIGGTAGAITANTLSIGNTNGGSLPGGINLTGANMVNTLAVQMDSTTGSLAFTNGKALTIGSGTTGFNGIVATGNPSAIGVTTTAGGITVNQNISSAGPVTLTSAGTIAESGTGAISTTGLLTTSSVGGTTLSNANVVGSYSAANATSGNISFTNNGALSVGFAGIINSAAGGTISLTDTAVNTAITNAISTIGTSNGSITLTADKMNLWVGTGANISAGTGNVTLQNFTATNAINVGSTVDTTASTLELSQTELNFINTTGLLTIGNTTNSGAITVSAAATLAHNTALVNGSGGIAINGAITASVNNLTLNTTGAVTQTAAISATGLELLTGSYTLTNTGNSIGTVAGNAASVSLTNNSNLSVGTVNTAGLTATGAITLSSFGGALTQTAGISTPGLLTTSSYLNTTLNGANSVGSLSSSIVMTGSYSFNNTGPGTLAINGITNLIGGGISVTNAGVISIIGAINGGTGAVNLTTTGASGWIREVGPSGLITAGTLTTNNSSSAGTSLNGGTNMISTLNATDVGMVYLINGTALNVTGITASDVLINNAGSIATSGAVTASNSVSMTGVGINNSSTITGNLGVSLDAGVGTLQNIGTGIITNGGGTSTGAINLTGDKMVLTNGAAGPGQVIAGAGAVNINNSTLTNAIDLGSTTDAANLALELSNAELATISTTGLLSIGNTGNSGAITVSAPLTLSTNTVLANGANGILINGAITATGQNLTLNTAGAATQAAGANITAAGLELLGAGSYTLTDSTNSIATLAGNAGSVSLVDSTALSVGTVNTAGLTSTGAVSLTAGGAISQTAAISASGLTTSSVGGTILNSANTVGSFNASNSSSGNIALTNTAAALSLNGMNNSFAGGSATVSNTGAISITGLIAAAGGGAINLTALGAGGSITETGSTSSISTTGLLTTSSVTGQNFSPTIGTNSVGSFNATNSTSGGISLTNTDAALTITGLSQSGGGAVIVKNTGDLATSGAIAISGATPTAVTLGSSGNLNVGNTITGTGGGALNLILSHGAAGSATLASNLSLAGGSLDVQNTGVTGTGTLNVSTGAISNSGTLTAATLVNNGSVYLSGTGSSVTGALTQNGLLDVALGGTLAAPGFTNTGTLAGSGTFNLGTGTLTNNGIIAPGGVGTLGTLSITGNLVMGAAGVVNMDVNNPTAGNFDVLNVSGTATLTGGTMNISGSGAGTYDLLNATGGFGGTKFAAINSGFFVQSSTYTANTLIVDLQYGISANELSELVQDTLIYPSEDDGSTRGSHFTSTDLRRGAASGAAVPKTVCQ